MRISISVLVAVAICASLMAVCDGGGSHSKSSKEKDKKRSGEKDKGKGKSRHETKGHNNDNKNDKRKTVHHTSRPAASRHQTAVKHSRPASPERHRPTEGGKRVGRAATTRVPDRGRPRSRHADEAPAAHVNRPRDHAEGKHGAHGHRDDRKQHVSRAPHARSPHEHQSPKTHIHRRHASPPENSPEGPAKIKTRKRAKSETTEQPRTIDEALHHQTPTAAGARPKKRSTDDANLNYKTYTNTPSSPRKAPTKSADDTAVFERKRTENRSKDRLKKRSQDDAAVSYPQHELPSRPHRDLDDYGSTASDTRNFNIARFFAAAESGSGDMAEGGSELSTDTTFENTRQPERPAPIAAAPRPRYDQREARTRAPPAAEDPRRPQRVRPTANYEVGESSRSANPLPILYGTQTVVGDGPWPELKWHTLNYPLFESDSSNALDSAYPPLNPTIMPSAIPSSQPTPTQGTRRPAAAAAAIPQQRPPGAAAAPQQQRPTGAAAVPQQQRPAAAAATTQQRPAATAGPHRRRNPSRLRRNPQQNPPQNNRAETPDAQPTQPPRATQAQVARVDDVSASQDSLMNPTTNKPPKKSDAVLESNSDYCR